MDYKIQRKATFKIVIRRVEEPFSNDPFAELDWICQSLGFFDPISATTSSHSTSTSSNRGAIAEKTGVVKHGKTAASVFKEILASAERDSKALTSTALSKRLEMSRGAVINHLNNLQRSGLIVRQGRHYFPRSKSISRTIQEIEEDIERIFQKMKKTAQEIDKEMGIEFKE